MPIIITVSYDRCIPLSFVGWMGCILCAFFLPKKSIFWALFPTLCILLYYVVVFCKFMMQSIEDVRQKQGEFSKDCEDLLIPVKSEELNDDEECVICYHTFLRDSDDSFQPVKICCTCKTSVYHRGCIKDWFKKKSTCPICRIDLRSKINIFR